MVVRMKKIPTCSYYMGVLSASFGKMNKNE